MSSSLEYVISTNLGLSAARQQFLNVGFFQNSLESIYTVD